MPKIELHENTFLERNKKTLRNTSVLCIILILLYCVGSFHYEVHGSVSESSHESQHGDKLTQGL